MNVVLNELLIVLVGLSSNILYPSVPLAYGFLNLNVILQVLVLVILFIV